MKRTAEQHNELNQQVQQLWGSEQKQEGPTFNLVVTPKDGSTDKSVDVKVIDGQNAISPDSNTIDVKLKLEQRRKGLLWYPTYKVGFAGDTTIQ